MEAHGNASQVHVPNKGTSGFVVDLESSDPAGQPGPGSGNEGSCYIKQEVPRFSLEGTTAPEGTAQNTAPGGGSMVLPRLPTHPVDTENSRTQAIMLGRPTPPSSETLTGHHATVFPRGLFGFHRDRSDNLRGVELRHPGIFPAVDGKSATPAMLLSQECQKRRFNPKFTEWHDGNGHYKCAVNLNGKIVTDFGIYDTSLEAKAAVSTKALVEVRKLPCDDPACKPAAILTEAVKQGIYGGVPKSVGVGWAPTENRTSSQGRRRNDHYTGQSSISRENRVSHHQPPSGLSNNYNDNFSLHSQQDFLMGQVQHLFGRVNGPSNWIAQDPLASRAFLEGMALGARLSQPTADRSERNTYAMPPVPWRSGARPHGDANRHRERSPVTAPGSRYARVRSPIHRRKN
ncbi:uncharacterized protein F4812DRAFT_285942 [Daldinia caldariorum]|uniref:uncharacterized protein n=1 Tax=Daldinia caldariorum TaxID=326644 RepID=UPI0020078234|nr:uncharacterized protein F4812DRAFT_285942 [Daldinia caldariorum]KAI1463152.1 hypothetical protein F4812DRAFT_285942 [Daldinia caldariorum]